MNFSVFPFNGLDDRQPSKRLRFLEPVTDALQVKVADVIKASWIVAWAITPETNVLVRDGRGKTQR